MRRRWLQKGRARESGPHTSPPPPDPAMPVQHRMHGADRRTDHLGQPLLQPLPDLGGAPARILLLQPDDSFLYRHGQLVSVAMRPPTTVGQAPCPDILVALIDLVAGLARDPELVAQHRHLLAVEQAGDKSNALVHDVTLLPRHAPLLLKGQSVTHVSGIRCYLSLRKDRFAVQRLCNGRRTPAPVVLYGGSALRLRPLP